MPNIRRLPPAPSIPFPTVATFDPTQPGSYAWEPLPVKPPSTTINVFDANGSFTPSIPLPNIVLIDVVLVGGGGGGGGGAASGGSAGGGGGGSAGAYQ